MQKLKLLISSATFMGLVGVGQVHAQEPAKPKTAPKPERFKVDPEVKKKFEEQAQRSYVPPDLAVVEWEKAPDAVSNRVSARLLSAGDQSVLVAIPLTADQKQALGAIWPTVMTVEEADHQMILGDELCLRYPVALDFELSRLESKVGLVVELEVGTTQDRRPLVLFVRGS